jgi:hypothetical protein
MAKKFYGIDNQGKVLLERRSSDPTPEQGRVYVETDVGVLKACADGTNSVVVVLSDGGTYTISINGNVTGDVTGDVTGNVTGNLTGDVTGKADEASLADVATVAKYAS